MTPSFNCYKKTTLKNFTGYIGIYLCILYLASVSSPTLANTSTYMIKFEQAGRFNDQTEVESAAQQLLQQATLDQLRVGLHQELSQSIQTPSWTTEGYPNSNYLNNTHQQSTLEVPSAKALQLLLAGETEAGYDYVTIDDKRYSGSMAQQMQDHGGALTVASNSVALDFFSDGSLTRKGIRVDVVPYSSAGQSITSTTHSDYGEQECSPDDYWCDIYHYFQSHGWDYLSNIVADWVEWTHKPYTNNQHKVILSKHFEGAEKLLVSLQGETELDWDYIEIDQLPGEQFSGHLDHKVVVDGSTVIVSFFSDGSVVKKGVEVTVEPLIDSHNSTRALISALSAKASYTAVADGISHFRQLLDQVAQFKPALATTYRAQLNAVRSIQTVAGYQQDEAGFIAELSAEQAAYLKTQGAVAVSVYEIGERNKLRLSDNNILSAYLRFFVVLSSQNKSLSNITDTDLQQALRDSLKLKHQHPMVGQSSKALQPVAEIATDVLHGEGLQLRGFASFITFSETSLHKLASISSDVVTAVVDYFSDDSSNTISLLKPLSYEEYTSLTAGSKRTNLTKSLQTPWMAIGSEGLYIHQGETALTGDTNEYRHYHIKNVSDDKLYLQNSAGTPPWNIRDRYPSDIELVKTIDGYYYVSEDKLFKYQLKDSNEQNQIYSLSAVIDFSSNQHRSGQKYIVDKYSLAIWQYNPLDHTLLHYAQYQHTTNNIAINNLANTDYIDPVELDKLIDQIKSAKSPDHWINYQYLNDNDQKLAERLVFKNPETGILHSLIERVLNHDQDTAYIIYDKNRQYNAVDAGEHSFILNFDDTVGEKLKVSLCDTHSPASQCKPARADIHQNQFQLNNQINSEEQLLAFGLSDRSIAVIPSFVGIMQPKVNSQGITVEHFQSLPVLGFEYTADGSVKLLLLGNDGERSIDIPGDNKGQLYIRIITDQPLEDSVQKQFDSGALAQYLPGKYYFKNHQATKLIRSIVDDSSFPIVNNHLIEELTRLTHVDQRYLLSNNGTLKSLSQRQAVENLFINPEYLTGEYVASNQKALDFLMKADNKAHTQYSNNRQQLNHALSKSNHSASKLNEEIAKNQAVSDSGFYGSVRINNKTKNWQKELVIGEVFYGGNQDFFAVLIDESGNIISVQIPISSHLSLSHQLVPSSIPEETIDRIKVSVNGLFWSDWYKMVDSEIEHHFNHMGIESPTDYMDYIVEILKKSKPVLAILNQRRTEAKDSNNLGQSAKLTMNGKYAVNNLLNALAPCIDDHRRELMQGTQMQMTSTPKKELCDSGVQVENDLTDSEHTEFEVQNSRPLNGQQSLSVSTSTYAMPVMTNGEMQNNGDIETNSRTRYTVNRVPQSIQISPSRSMQNNSDIEAGITQRFAQNNAPRGSIIRESTTIQRNSQDPVELCPTPSVQVEAIVVNVPTTQLQQNQASRASANGGSANYKVEIQRRRAERQRIRNQQNHHHNHQVCTLGNCISIVCFSSLITIIYYGIHH